MLKWLVSLVINGFRVYKPFDLQPCYWNDEKEKKDMLVSIQYSTVVWQKQFSFLQSRLVFV